MTWQATAAFLACARIGAVHSAVFAGFSAESLRDRVKDCDCKVVITTEYVPLKTKVRAVLMVVREREVERLSLLKLVRFLHSPDHSIPPSIPSPFNLQFPNLRPIHIIPLLALDRDPHSSSQIECSAAPSLSLSLLILLASLEGR